MRNFLLSVGKICQSQFWPHRRNWHVILDQLLRKYDFISIFQDGGSGRSILLPVSYFWCPCLQKVKVYQQTKFRRHQWSTYINLWLKYNDFWFGKTNVHLIGILLPVLISTTSRNFHVIMYHATEFRPNRTTHPLQKYDVISIFQDGGRDR